MALPTNIRTAIGLMAALSLTPAFALDGSADPAPTPGGILNFAISAETPNYDCHAQSSYAGIHFLAPFYSTLLQIDLKNYPKIRGDLAESWKVSADNLTYTFKLRHGVTFHDGSPLTSTDVKATYERLRDPPIGVLSARKAMFEAIGAIDTPDPLTVVFHAKTVDTSLLNTFASPWNCVYSAALLTENIKAPETKILGTGPFKFQKHERGGYVSGVRNDAYFVTGQPYLDGFKGHFLSQPSAMINALQGGQVMAEFRGVSPAERDRLKAAMGDNIRIEESPWALSLVLAFNTQRKPFDDVRVRQALTLGIDRGYGSQYLSKISTLHLVGGIMRPGSDMATPPAELAMLPGYSSNIRESRQKARKLLAEAGVPNLTIKLTNRTIAQPYTAAGIFLIDQWRQIGVTVEHQQMETSSYTTAASTGNFDAILDFANLTTDEPSEAAVKFISADRSAENRSRAIDRDLDALFDRQRGEVDPAIRAKTLKEFEARALTQAYQVPFLFWRRIVVTSPTVKGWVMSPSHTLGQDLAGVWLDPSAAVGAKAASPTGATK